MKILFILIIIILFDILKNNKEDRYLIVKGCAGLGNRLFTIIDALKYCELSNRKLYVDWSDGQFGKKNENIFHQFFFVDHPLYTETLPKNVSESSDVFPISWSGNLTKSIYDLFNVGIPNFFVKKIPSVFLSSNIISRKSQLWVYKDQNLNYGLKAIFDKKNMDFGSNLSLNKNFKYLIYCDFNPFHDNIKYLKHLRLNNSCLSHIDQWVKKHEFSENVLGIHVRFSDKKPNKSVESLIEYLQKKYNSMLIFLSTDNLDIEKHFRSSFKNKLISFPKNLPHKLNSRGIHMWGLDNNNADYNVEMLRTSIIDMWLLSKCKFLFYQGNSSFSNISKFLHTKPENCINWETVIN